MNTKTKVILITLGVAIPAFLLGDMIWPMSPDLTPTEGQVPFFIFLAAVEALALGLGVSFVVMCWKQAAAERIVFLAVAWLLMSWWLHDNLHKANGVDIHGLLLIEYGFHFTLVIAGLILARYFWKSYQPNVSNPTVNNMMQ